MSFGGRVSGLWGVGYVTEKTISMELLETNDLLCYYKALTPFSMLSNFSLPVVLIFYGTQHNNIEWNPFSS